MQKTNYCGRYFRCNRKRTQYRHSSNNHRNNALRSVIAHVDSRHLPQRCVYLTPPSTMPSSSGALSRLSAVATQGARYEVHLSSGGCDGCCAGGWVSDHYVSRGGCTNPGDAVADTPQQFAGDSFFACDASLNTCNAAGRDPVKNLMNYVDDTRMDKFTTGQATRMSRVWDAYRAS